MKRQVGSIAHQRINSSGVPTTYYTFYDNFLLYSQNHRRLKNGKWSGGGPFLVRHETTDIGNALTGNDYGISDNRVRKPWSTWIGGGATSPVIPTSYEILKSEADSYMATTSSYGATGWKRARPGNPTAGLLTSVSELVREGLPSLPLRLFRSLTGFRDAFRKGGSEWLNLQFGWMPLLGDIRDMYETYRKLDKKLAQLVRDNGKGIHRRRTIEDNVTISILQDSVTGIPFSGWAGRKPPSSAMTGSTRTIITSETRSKIWFVGKFRYYVPDIGSSQWTRRATAALFGVNPTPEVIWNLLPWSWLIDWFSNMGDIMSNMSSNAVSNLTAEYAFAMRSSSTKETVISSTSWNGMTQSTQNQPNDFWSLGPGSGTSSYVRKNLEVKSRTVASPYGFGIQFDSLSDYQLGIIAALGFSRW